MLLRPLEPDDFPAVLALWGACEGIDLSSADTQQGFTKFLTRNPELSWSAWEGETLVCAVLCGHDGRRGYIHHLATHPDHRGKGIGGSLLQKCTEGLSKEGIQKAHITVLKDNESGKAFWRNQGWYERPELDLMSLNLK
jgi:ribosomal protein S18 acetylase RimI-like enzyme